MQTTTYYKCHSEGFSAVKKGQVVKIINGVAYDLENNMLNVDVDYILTSEDFSQVEKENVNAVSVDGKLKRKNPSYAVIQNVGDVFSNIEDAKEFAESNSGNGKNYLVKIIGSLEVVKEYKWNLT